MVKEPIDMQEYFDEFLQKLATPIAEALKNQKRYSEEEFRKVQVKLDTIANNPDIGAKLEKISNYIRQFDLNGNGELLDDYIELKQKAERALAIAQNANGKAIDIQKRLDALEEQIGGLSPTMDVDKHINLNNERIVRGLESGLRAFKLELGSI